MKSFYICSLRAEAVRALRAAGTAAAEEAHRAYEAAEEATEAAFINALKKLTTGAANVIYTSHAGHDMSGTPYRTFTAYHRSPKKPGFIQESHYYIKRGEMVPVSDAQHATPAEAYRHGAPSGAYIIE